MNEESNLCRNRIVSEEYIDIIRDFNVPMQELVPMNIDEKELDYCEKVLADDLSILYIKASQVPSLNISLFRYQYIPACYGLIEDDLIIPNETEGETLGFDQIIPRAEPELLQPEITRGDLTPLTESGILQVNGPPLELTGNGVVIAIIDTGIRYQLPSFLKSNGTSRILALWDQTNQSGDSPEGFLYGTEFTQEMLNQNLLAKAPPLSTDPNGHGTKVAGVAAGYDRNTGFRGAAPDASLVVVKLKEAKQFLREYYQIPTDVPCYQETDLLMALSYVQNFAIKLKRPLVICMSLGTNMGDHNGNTVLDTYVNRLARQRSHCVVIGGGNEGNSGCHYAGSITPQSITSEAFEEVELLVSQKQDGLWVELWGDPPSLYTVAVTSPSGETIQQIPYQLGQTATFNFVYANTTLQVDYVLVEQGSGQQLIVMRFKNPVAGIWKIRVYANGGIGTYNMWLPMTNFLSGDTGFLKSNQFITMTEPSYARDTFSVTAYNTADNSFYLNSGRGYSADGTIIPQLSAPGVSIATPLGADTGSCYAAALTAGAAADFMEWAVVRGNDNLVNTSSVKNYFIRGATRRKTITYPTPEWGYGTLNLEGVFNAIAGL